jgi:hypothetical protein
MSAELAAEFVVLYGRGLTGVEIWSVSGAPELRLKEEMKGLGYPTPTGRAYYCLPIQRVDAAAWEYRITPTALIKLRDQVSPGVSQGHPVSTTWLRLVEATARS